MSNKNLSAEQIDVNYKKVLEFVNKLGERSVVVNSLLDVLGERYALCPASAKLEQHSCFPGGLVEHSLRVLTNALKIRKAFEYDISLESIIITALFHDLGKIGDLEESYYIEQDSQWHRDKLGEMYKYNKKCQYMTVPHRSVWLLQQFGIKLTRDEMIAILVHDGQYVDDNKSYKNREPLLADIIHHADFIASKQEKES
jgi:HD superfamily phosphohydrolase YqeK